MENEALDRDKIDSDVGALYQLQDALCLLADEADAQGDYLLRHGYGSCLDELALMLGAWYAPGERWEFHKLLSMEQLEAIGTVDAQLERMSGPEMERLWSSESLNEPAWTDVRQLARRALQAFGFAWHPDLRRELSKRWPTSWAQNW